MKFNLRIILTTISIISIQCVVFAIEPTGTIGQPLPKKHVFHDNDTILRVVPNNIQIVNVNTGAVEDEFGNLNDYNEVAFSHNASHVAVLNDSGKSKIITVDIWDVNTRERIISWDIESTESYVPIFSPIPPLFATVSNNEIHIWNWQTGKYIDTMVGERRPLESCYIRQTGRTCSGSRTIIPAFTPDGKHLIVASGRPDIEIWNVERRELVGHFEGHIGKWVEGAVINPDGTRMASFDRVLGIVYVWDMETRQLIWKLKSGSNYVTDVDFTPDSRHLYVATKTVYSTVQVTDPSGQWDEEIRVWDIHTGLQIDTIETKFHDIYKINLSPDGNKLLLHYKDAEVIWEINEKRVQFVWSDFIRHLWYYEVATSLDGNTLASVSPHTIKTWDLTSREMHLLIPNDGYSFRGVAISPDSQKLAVGRDFHKWIELRDLRTGELEARLPHSLSYIEVIAYSHSGRYLAVSDDWDELAILDIEKSEKPQPLHIQIDLGKPTNFADFGFSKDDVYFAASAVTGKNGKYEYWTLLWKRVDEQFVFQYAWNPSFSYLPTFTTTPDGESVLATANRSGIQIWELLPDAPQLLTTLPGDGPVQFSPDGRYLFANRDESFQIWDWQVNRPIKHQPIPSCIAISQDGSVLVSYDDELNAQYLIWDTQNLLSSLPYSVEPNGKKIVTFGQIKRNQLMQNFPNPFNPETWIPFQLANESLVTINIYTPSGKLVRKLTPGILSAGQYTSQSKAIHWDGQNNDGEPVSSGIYLYTINTDNFSDTRKMIIRK